LGGVVYKDWVWYNNTFKEKRILGSRERGKMDNYESLIERVVRASGKDREEIEGMVDAKRKKLSGLISKEGATQIVSAELGISFDEERVKIVELVQGMRRANVIGKITRVYPVREFNKNGREGKIGSFLLGDESSNVRVVMWDLHHIELIEEEKLKEGSVVEISNSNVRNGEIHLSGFSDIKLSNEKLGKVKKDRSFEFGYLKDVSPGKNMKTRAVIVQSFEPKYFEAKDGSGKKALLNVVLDDGTETIRAVFFGEQINKLGLSDEEIFSVEKFNGKKEGLLGEEKVFSGSCRNNKFFNNVEMAIDNVEEVDVDGLVKELEAKV
jgi:ssDNA-binding replication factor A large subunit